MATITLTGNSDAFLSLAKTIQAASQEAGARDCSIVIDNGVTGALCSVTNNTGGASRSPRIVAK